MSNIADTLFWRNMARRQQELQQGADAWANNLIHQGNFNNAMYRIQEDRNRIASEQGRQAFQANKPSSEQYQNEQETIAAQMGFDTARSAQQAQQEQRQYAEKQKQLEQEQRDLELTRRFAQDEKLQRQRLDQETSDSLLRHADAMAQLEAQRKHYEAVERANRGTQSQKLSNDAAYQTLQNEYNKNAQSIENVQRQLTQLVSAPPGTDIEGRKQQLEQELTRLQSDQKDLEEVNSFIKGGIPSAIAYQQFQNNRRKAQEDAMWLRIGEALSPKPSPQIPKVSTPTSEQSGYVPEQFQGLNFISPPVPPFGSDLPSPPTAPTYRVRDPNVHYGVGKTNRR